MTTKCHPELSLICFTKTSRSFHYVCTHFCFCIFGATFSSFTFALRKSAVFDLLYKNKPFVSLRLHSLLFYGFLYPHLGHTPFSFNVTPHNGHRSIVPSILYSSVAAFAPLVNVIFTIFSFSFNKS